MPLGDFWRAPAIRALVSFCFRTVMAQCLKILQLRHEAFVNAIGWSGKEKWRADWRDWAWRLIAAAPRPLLRQPQQTAVFRIAERMMTLISVSPSLHLWLITNSQPRRHNYSSTTNRLERRGRTRRKAVQPDGRRLFAVLLLLDGTIDGRDTIVYTRASDFTYSFLLISCFVFSFQVFHPQLIGYKH